MIDQAALVEGSSENPSHRRVEVPAHIRTNTSTPRLFALCFVILWVLCLTIGVERLERRLEHSSSILDRFLTDKNTLWEVVENRSNSRVGMLGAFPTKEESSTTYRFRGSTLVSLRGNITPLTYDAILSFGNPASESESPESFHSLEQLNVKFRVAGIEYVLQNLKSKPGEITVRITDTNDTQPARFLSLKQQMNIALIRENGRSHIRLPRSFETFLERLFLGIRTPAERFTIRAFASNSTGDNFDFENVETLDLKCPNPEDAFPIGTLLDVFLGTHLQTSSPPQIPGSPL